MEQLKTRDDFYKANIESLKWTIEFAEENEKLKPNDLYKIVYDHVHSLYWHERSREFMDDKEFKGLTDAIEDLLYYCCD